jgi:hypothetical protein
MAQDDPLCGICEICMFGSLLLTLMGTLVLLVGFDIDTTNDDGSVLNVGIVLLICYLVGLYIVLTTWLYGYITLKIINFIFGEPDRPTIWRWTFIIAIITLPILLTGSMWLTLNDIFSQIVSPNNPFYTFLKIFISHFIGCIILILMYGVILCGIYIKMFRQSRHIHDTNSLDV